MGIWTQADTNPPDRLLVASARYLREPLVTADRRILDYGRTTGLVTWNNFSLGTTGYWTTQIIVEDLDANGNVQRSSSG
jgi:hypothetical protein